AKTYIDSDGSTIIEGFCSDVTARKQAEEEQSRIKEQLEKSVAERTAELSNYIRELEQQNMQESLLLEMGELLQVCHSTCESYAIISKYAGLLFPDYSGALFLFDNTGRWLKEAVSWNSPDDTKTEFGHDECWALKRGKLYSVCDEGKQLLCGHVQSRKHAYLCAPLITQGKVFGLLYIQMQSSSSRECKAKVEATYIYGGGGRWLPPSPIISACFWPS
ncbi:MAG: GAF domain-containing protein, partial [Desulfobacteraceae bacterium]|nr:GAF domain-containing protein [Desulfobacteraceae bacterium]